MNHHFCDLEPAVRQALEHGHWSDSVRRHVAGCAACSDLLLVATALRAHPAAQDDAAPLPDPGLIWWRAQVEARSAAAERATLAITLVQRLAVACGAVLGGLGLWRLWPQVREWATVLLPARGPLPLPDGMAHPGLVIAASLAALVLLLLLDLRDPRFEE